jgi:hypothetical protein
MELRNLWLAGLAVATTVVAYPQLANNPGTALQARITTHSSSAM